MPPGAVRWGGTAPFGITVLCPLLAAPIFEAVMFAKTPADEVVPVSRRARIWSPVAAPAAAAPGGAARVAIAATSTTTVKAAAAYRPTWRCSDGRRRAAEYRDR